MGSPALQLALPLADLAARSGIASTNPQRTKLTGAKPPPLTWPERLPKSKPSRLLRRNASREGSSQSRARSCPAGLGILKGRSSGSTALPTVISGVRSSPTGRDCTLQRRRCARQAGPSSPQTLSGTLSPQPTVQCRLGPGRGKQPATVKTTPSEWRPCSYRRPSRFSPTAWERFAA